MKKIGVLVILILLLAGCGGQEYFKQIYLEDMKAHMEEGQDGFILLVNKNDQDFQQYVKDVAENEEIEIGMYNAYESEQGAEDNRPVLPFEGFDRFNQLYYVEGNEAKGSLEVKNYEDMQLTEEINHFINLHK